MRTESSSSSSSYPSSIPPSRSSLSSSSSSISTPSSTSSSRSSLGTSSSNASSLPGNVQSILKNLVYNLGDLNKLSALLTPELRTQLMLRVKVLPKDVKMTPIEAAHELIYDDLALIHKELTNNTELLLRARSDLSNLFAQYVFFGEILIRYKDADTVSDGLDYCARTTKGVFAQLILDKQS